MKKANLDIRTVAKESGIKLWQIADKLGINDITFCKWLRKELPREKKELVFAAIDELRGESDI